MKVEVLLATMYQDDWSIVKKCNINSNAIIINQCNQDKVEEISSSYGKIKFISTQERGLSKSRNMAIKNSTADICILSDDDIVFYTEYVDVIIKAFNELPDADVLVFNIISKNTDKRAQEKLFKRVKKIPFYKSYSSVHIAFKRKSIVDNDIVFDTNFGTGSGVYSFAEDSLFFAQIHKKKLKAYTYPAIIADLYTEESSWFHGFDKKYFYDTGAFLAAGYPCLKSLYKWYYPLRFCSRSELSFKMIMKYINKGIAGYKKKMPYFEND